MTIGYSDFGAVGARHPTGAALRSVSARLGLQYDEDQQDWERFHADPDRIPEFLTLYRNGGLNDDERFALMELILASASDGEVDAMSTKLWDEIIVELSSQSELHGWSVWDWSGFDEATGKLDDEYPAIPALAPLMEGTYRYDWARKFPDTPPNAAILREMIPHRWVRFHSLPDSKRYPETPAELETIVTRYSRLAAEVLEESDTIWMVANRYETIDEQRVRLELQSVFLQPQFSWCLLSPVSPDEEVISYAGKSNLTRHNFIALLKKVAKSEEGQILWYSPGSGEIFAPYDGGCDLFLANTARRNTLMARFSDWRPIDSDL